MSAPLFRGCGTALMTPFRNGKIDFPALGRLIEFQLENGIAALVACGSTGEPATMTEEEWESVVAFVVKKAACRVPVIAGTGGNNTPAAIARAHKAKELGADAQLCVTPFYNKTTQAGLIAHYRAIARDGALPLIVYNVPSRTGLNMLPATLAAIAQEENVIGMKEASGNVSQIMEMMRLCGDRIAFYSGSDELTAPVMALGGAGVISVLSNIMPRRMADLAAAPVHEAAKINMELLPLMNAMMSEVNPIPVKAAAALMGLCKNEVRMPLVPMSREKKAKMKQEMQKAGLL